jgi:tetratricopeptide (TPR) repeat protein
MLRNYSMPKRILIALVTIFFHCSVGFADVEKINKLIDAKKYPQAQQQIKNLLKEDKNNPQLLFIKGVLLSETNKIEKAIETFQALTESHPTLPEPYNNLAVLYAQIGDFDKAKASLEQAIKTHPSYATAHINLGDIYTRMASESYTQALQIDNQNKNAKTKLSSIKKLFGFQPLNKKIKLPQKKAESLDTNEDKKISGDNTNSQKEVTINDVEFFIMEWKTSWETKDFAKYINFYSNKFINNKNQDFESYKKFRKPRIIGKKVININLENILIEKKDGFFLASFLQNYKADNIESSTQKKLFIQIEDGNLKITNEAS